MKSIEERINRFHGLMLFIWSDRTLQDLSRVVSLLDL